jgi:hypothetical protein
VTFAKPVISWSTEIVLAFQALFIENLSLDQVCLNLNGLWGHFLGLQIGLAIQNRESLWDGATLFFKVIRTSLAVVTLATYDQYCLAIVPLI